jgi:four helix bundle protein
MQSCRAVGVRDFTELVAWQRADELRQFIHEITSHGPVCRDFKFKEQIRDAADAPCRNLAEGLGRYGHREFARFVAISISSVDEVKDCLRAGRQRSFFADDLCEQGYSKARRARGTMIGLLRYLRSTEAPDPFNDQERDNRSSR